MTRERCADMDISVSDVFNPIQNRSKDKLAIAPWYLEMQTVAPHYMFTSVYNHT